MIGDFERYFNRTLTLGEVMEASIQMQKATGKTVLVTLPKSIGEFQPGHLPGAYSRALDINSKKLRRFRNDFHEVAAFTDGSLETYIF